MRHRKLSNIGIIFEALNKCVTYYSSKDKISEGAKVFSVIRKYFLDSSTYMHEIYKEIYSPIIYGQTNNHYYASKYLQYMIEEYKGIDENRLHKEVKSLISELDSFAKLSSKQILNTKIDTYKVLASFKVLADSACNRVKLTPQERLRCEQTVMEHLINNEEVKRINESSATITSSRKPLEEMEEQQLTSFIAVKKFKEKYNVSLTTEQNDFMNRYLTTQEKPFYRWVEKKLKNIVKEIDNKMDNVEDEKIEEKLSLVKERFESILNKRKVDETGMTDILLGFDLFNCLKLF